jgi:DNA replication licensing factor MCM5
MSKNPKIIEMIAKSVASTLHGLVDEKKAIACLLFGGSTKLLPDHMRLRGDINILLIGDPSTAKS